MKLKTLLYGFLYFIFAISCSERILEPEMAYQTTVLKAAAISTNRYVAKTGNDNNAGTLAAPFLTIQKAANVANPGDSVIVRDGVYVTTDTQFFNISRGGTASSRIVFKSEHKWGAVLDGQNTATYPLTFNGGASYIDIIDFEIKNIHRGIWANDAANPSNYITLQGNNLHDFGRNQADGGGSLYIGRNHHHWTITKNQIYNIGKTGPDNVVLNLDHAIYINITAPTLAEIPHDFTITNNIIWGCSGDAIQSGANNVLIANNVIAWSNENSAGSRGFLVTASDGITGGGLNYTIANNIFYEPPVSSGYALRSYTGTSGWVVKNNIVYGGRMWYPDNTKVEITAAMAGGNFGQTDCENGQIDPKFISAIKANAPNVDFRLQASSPAISAGASIGLTCDFSGNPITGTPEIGAYEYLGSSSTTYYNTQVTATATKNDCGTGSTGSTVTYTVPAKKYSSTVSQSAVDNLAVTDLNTNKQAYANANGICTAIPVYYNTQISATATKNDCGAGYTGSTLTYTVLANKYSSAVSQAAADNLATTDLNTNKQAYANANGTCTTLPTPSSFGLTTVGSIPEKGDNGFWIANSFTAASNTTVSKMNIYVGTASGKARLGIYSDKAGQPGTLIAQTGEITLVNGWNSGMLGSSKILTSGVTYWIAIELTSSATTLYFNNATGRLRYKSYTYGLLPSSAPLKCISGTGIYSVYAN
jgi:hypothetical protein